jgi:HSP20 family protein
MEADVEDEEMQGLRQLLCPLVSAGKIQSTGESLKRFFRCLLYLPDLKPLLNSGILRGKGSSQEVMGMPHVKWEPFRDLMAMQDRMSRVIDQTLSRLWKEEMIQGTWSPPVDIVERENDVLIKIDLPDMNQNEIDIRVEESTLIVQGERKFAKESAEEKYVQIERPYGIFRRTFTVPRRIDQEAIKASYKDGVLRILLPKRQEIAPKQVVVES